MPKAIIAALPEKNWQERVRRKNVLLVIVACMFSLLIIRLFYVQIVHGERNFAQSIDNQVVQETINAPRGVIYDRNGVIIAQNRPSYSVGIIPILVPRNFPIIDNLLKIRGSCGTPLFDSTQLVSTIRRGRQRSSSQMAILREDISFDYVSVIKEHLSDLPGIVLETSMRRDYPLGQSAFHVTGYMGPIDSLQFDTLRFMGYERNDFIGIAGIERQYEHYLRGQNGFHFIERNAFGRRLGVMENKPSRAPIRGHNIHLSIDARMQQVAYESFADTMRGAVVALDPRTGEVLTIVSFPSVDPNIFSLERRIRDLEWRRAVNNPSRPLTNRAVIGTYPPGSTFKMVPALAAFNSLNISSTARMRQSCTGTFRIGTRTARCWQQRGHGFLDMYSALKVSCNVYFYQLGLQLGDSLINHYSEILGLGGRTGIDLPVESPGFMSGRDAYNARFRNRGWVWTQGLVLDMAIGQQQIFTPLQLAVMVGSLGNTVERFQPFLLSKVVDADDEIIFERDVGDEHFSLKSVSPEAFHAVKVGMQQSIDLAGGTGRRSRVEGINVGGKTGTAQNPHGGSHALFVAVAPLENPSIAIAVVVETADGGGGMFAAPIAGNILNFYFNETPKGREVAARYRMLPRERRARQL